MKNIIVSLDFFSPLFMRQLFAFIVAPPDGRNWCTGPASANNYH